MSIKIEGFPPSTAGITGALVYRGELDPTSPPADITSASKGDFYVVSAVGTLATVALNINDHIVFNQDAADPLTASMFDKIDNTEPSASETVAGIIEISTNAEATAGTATDKALVPSNISSIGTSQLNNDAGFITSGLQSGDNVSELVNDAGYLTSVAAASETVQGIIEIATNAEATAGTATDKALVPSNLSSVGTSQLNNDAGFITSGLQSGDNVSELVNDAGYLTSVAAASETVAGKIEIATNAEATAGTATDKALVPSNLSSVGTSQLNNDAGFITSGLQSGDNVSELVNDAGYLTSVAAASETVAGKIEIATNAEATAGTATDKALVPSNLSSVGTSQLNNDAGFITSGLQSGDNVSELVNDAGYLTSVAAASETVAGIIEISTNAEATAGTATDKALVPSNLSSVGTSQLNNDAGFITSGLQSGDNVSELVNDAGYLTSVAAASETVAGIIEISTNAEATAGTATDKALVPSNLSSVGTSQLNNDAGFITSGLQSGDNVSELVNDAGYLTSVAAASETVAGKIEISTNAEATAGTATDKALVPSNLSSIGTSQLNNDAGFITSGGGGSAPNVTTDSSGTNTTISTSTGIEEIHLIDNGSSSVTITLPTAGTVGSGYKYNVKRLGTATVTVSSSSNIDGGSFTLNLTNQSVTVVSNGSTYYVI